MICIGYANDAKAACVERYIADHDIQKIIVISGSQNPLRVDGADHVAYADVIMYVTFYRLLQEIDSDTLIVLDECLRTQNRYDLAYNCIRNYLNQTSHQLIFQYLPLIDSPEDFMILFDFDTRSRWKRHAFDAGLIRRESDVRVLPRPISLSAVPVPTSSGTHHRYAETRARLFATLGNKDPHTLPRQLALVSTVEKRAYIRTHPDERYVARNKRLGLPNVISYGEARQGGQYILVDLPHRFLDFSDFLWRTGQTACPVLVADLKVEHWYLTRYQEWSARLAATTSLLW